MRTFSHLTVTAALALGAVSAAAALAPNYQRIVELNAVLEHPGVANAFGAMQPIDRIEYVRTDLYRVTAHCCRLDVRIVDLPIPRGMVGARHFEARAGAAGVRAVGARTEDKGNSS